MDNERVLFVGMKPDGEPGSQGLHIWKVNGDVTSYKQRSRGLCLQGDTMWYSAHDQETNTWTFYQGEIGKETPTTRQRYSDKLNCQTLPSYPGSEVDQTWKLLLPGHGYLDVGELAPFAELPPVYFYPSRADKPIAMPFNRRQVLRENTTYYPFKGAYLLYGPHDDEMDLVGQRNLDGRSPHVVWWLYPSGRVDEVSLPAGPWLRGGSNKDVRRTNSAKWPARERKLI